MCGAGDGQVGGRTKREEGRHRYIYALRSCCARSEPVVSESCSLKSLVHIYICTAPPRASGYYDGSKFLVNFGLVLWQNDNLLQCLLIAASFTDAIGSGALVKWQFAPNITVVSKSVSFSAHNKLPPLRLSSFPVMKWGRAVGAYFISGDVSYSFLPEGRS